MLHKAATSFSPFKLQHLHNHLRSALNGANLNNTLNGASSSASASASGSSATASSASGSLGGPAASAGGAGGAKWHAGRSYSYQAFRSQNAPTAHGAASSDGSINNKFLDDEQEEAARLRASLRWKQASSSVSSSTRRQRSSSLSNPGLTSGVAVSSTPSNIVSILPRSSPYSFTQSQLQARYRHAFAQVYRKQHLITAGPQPAQISNTSDAQQRSSYHTLPESAPASPRRPTVALPTPSVRARSNSTSAIESSSVTPEPIIETVVPEAKTATEVPTSDPENTAATEYEHPKLRPAPPQPSLDEPAPQGANASDPFLGWLRHHRTYQNVHALRGVVREYRAKPESWSTARHEAFIQYLYALRQYGNVTKDIIDLYESHFKDGIVPSTGVYSVVVEQLAERSLQTYQILKAQELQNNAARLAPAASAWSDGKPLDVSTLPRTVDAMHDAASLAVLRQQSDEDYNSARNILTGLGRDGKKMRGAALNAVLSCAAVRGDIDTALAIFGSLEGDGKTPSRAGAKSFAYLLQAYAKASDWKAVQTVFEGFTRGVGRARQLVKRNTGKKASDLLDSPRANESEEAPPLARTREDDALVWNARIYARLLEKKPHEAIDLLERMMLPKDDTPTPNGDTLLSLIRGFSESGDFEAAFRWANRIHTLPTPSDLPSPPPKLEDTLNCIVSSSSDVAALQEAAGKTPLLPALGMHIRTLTRKSSEGESSTPTSPLSSASDSGFWLGSVFSDASTRTQTLSITPPPPAIQTSSDTVTVKIDLPFSAKMDEMIRTTRDPLQVYGIIKASIRKGQHVHPETLARLIEKLAALKAEKEIHDAYLIAYHSLTSLPNEDDQTSAWAYLEDRMLIAMANLGELEKTAMHRDRLLQAGAAPSADAYAAMITSARDTTDDATVALELFEEARRFGVVPNLYLFNILISKLSKARRTHLALSYFEQMKSVGIRPSAVTYGSVIAACCRTGDEKAATFLFNEMAKSPGFIPRVPPYNTMMQFFISTQPDREKALSYFDAMLRASVAPTGHTYKLLLDAYGSIDPVDMDSVRDVFDRLTADRNVTVTGSHWLSLMWAYGRTNDIDAVVNIFENIHAHPSSAKSRVPMPDVICYEGLFNVLLSTQRHDLLETYMDRMQKQFVRPTAYIYNILIRAYTASGNVEKARQVFDSLADPPSGVHATGNHAGDAPATGNKEAPVYREPSTFEAMIRCELSNGNHARAEELLQQAVQRAFPHAVISRLEKLIRGDEKATLFSTTFNRY